MGVLASALPSRANGRFPVANQLSVDPQNSAHLLLRATYGLLESQDAGQSFSWICENAARYLGAVDPSVGITDDGSLLAVSLNGIGVSHDAGCNWAFVSAGSSSPYPVDVTVEPNAPATSLVLSASVDGSQQVRLFESRDNARSFAALGALIGDDFFPATVEVAPSRAERLYVTGLTGEPRSILERSDDRGQTWQRFNVEPYETQQAFIAAVDPTDPDTLYVRVDDSPSDHLLVSHDAGENWQDAFSLGFDMLGFALSPDGQELLVGGPVAGAGGAGDAGLSQPGLYRASTLDLAFSPVQAALKSVRCLKWTAAGVYACAQEELDGFTLALSSDAGDSFTPLWHVTQLTPLECAAGSSASVCAADWPAIATQIGIGGGAGAAGAGTEPGLHAHGGCSLDANARALPGAFALSLFAALAGAFRARRWAGSRRTLAR